TALLQPLGSPARAFPRRPALVPRAALGAAPRDPRAAGPERRRRAGCPGRRDRAHLGRARHLRDPSGRSGPAHGPPLEPTGIRDPPPRAPVPPAGGREGARGAAPGTRLPQPLRPPRPLDGAPPAAADA